MKLLSEIATQLEPPYTTLAAWQSRGSLDCGTRVGKRLYYTESDIERIRNSAVYQIWIDRKNRKLSV
ncbi:MerR family transcriptional regulator [Rubinisphaera italica]|uniref:HTH merR-type domain-containing protein n=1 Tax=Rubinisphaera italica TaxID=2527969 RepID=A0A5C5XR83_9PLAN|nr:hypothetical protein Pan54_49930 [Rubinisphaera italica]